ncbi:hypothetical protein GTP46_04655 [Duganella sp. FT135W]|uniref:DUF2514 family protein n=1 Tax=Duganella flavida TaxID=2692175 RepID=A0A6L8K3Z7_9BURK|nr:hypothetical protein [Duganella flavida]MYM21940.1 hypothetical protein [Duganella flavida]
MNSISIGDDTNDSFQFFLPPSNFTRATLLIKNFLVFVKCKGGLDRNVIEIACTSLRCKCIKTSETLVTSEQARKAIVWQPVGVRHQPGARAQCVPGAADEVHHGMGDVVSWHGILAAALAAGALIAAEQAYEEHLISRGDKIGSDRVQGQWEKREATIKVDAEREAAVDSARARAETAALQSKFDQLAGRQQKDRVDHEIATKIAVAAALAGTERLSIAIAPAATDSVREGGEGQSAGPRAGAARETRADLQPTTAGAILRIAGDYGQLVRDYNAVVERFDAARVTCNTE